MKKSVISPFVFGGKKAMSIGYAQKLSDKKDVGTLGMPELFDPPYNLH